MRKPGWAGGAAEILGQNGAGSRILGLEVILISPMQHVFVSTYFVKHLVLGTGDKESNTALQIKYTPIKLIKKINK